MGRVCSATRLAGCGHGGAAGTGASARPGARAGARPGTGQDARAWPACGRCDRARHPPHREGDRLGCVVHLPPGPTRLARGGRGRLRALPADRAARLQRRRRRCRGRLTCRHPVLRPARRGARPGCAVPRPHDAPVRHRRAPDRAVPGPVQPRSPMVDRRHDGAACVPVLADGRRSGLAVGGDVPDGAGRPRLLQGVRRCPGGHSPAAPAGGTHPGQGQQPDLACRSRRGGDLRTAGGPGCHLRVPVVTALRVRRVRRSDHPLDPAAGQGRRPRRRAAGEHELENRTSSASLPTWCSRCGATPGCGCSRAS